MKNHGIDGADVSRHFRHGTASQCDGFKGGLFMGNGNIDPGKTLFRQLRKRLGEIPRGDGQGRIFTVDCVLFQPIPMQQGRPRMGHGPPHNPGANGFFRWCHVFMIPCERRNSKRGKRGRPSMVKKSPSTERKS